MLTFSKYVLNQIRVNFITRILEGLKFHDRFLWEWVFKPFVVSCFEWFESLGGLKLFSLHRYPLMDGKVALVQRGRDR